MASNLISPSTALKDAQANHVRESWVSAMELRLVKTELQKCHQYEGVNHYATCQDLSNRYVDMLRDHRVGGFLMDTSTKLTIHRSRVIRFKRRKSILSVVEQIHTISLLE